MLTNVTFSMNIAAVSPPAYAEQVLVGDFNGDGIADLAVPFSYGNGTQPGPILFFTGDGHGGFVDSTTALFSGQVPTAIFATRILSGDFNQDGRTDVVGLDSGQDAAPFAGAQSELFLSTPNGKMTVATANLPQRIVYTHGGMVGDVNGDGNLDVILLNLNTHDLPAVEILMGDGTGHFHEMDQLAPASYQNVGYNAGNTWGGLVDVNGDGFVDLILGTWNASTLPSEVYLNDGHGSFANATPIPLPDSGVSHQSVMQVQPIDLNGDGRPDLILSVTNGGAAGTSDFYTVGYLQVLINDGGGHFHDETAVRLPQSTQPNGGWIKFVQAIDLTGDGAADLVTQWWSPTGITTKIFLNDGAGKFSSVAQTIQGAATAIPNADGQGHIGFAVVVGNQLKMISDDLPQYSTATAQLIQNDYLAIARAAAPSDQTRVIVNAIDGGTQTEAQYVESLLSQVANTTIPAIAVEGSMYGAVGTSAEITFLVTQFLPGQVANAMAYGFIPQVYASEALGLAFAFGNESGSTSFAANFGPSNATMPNSMTGDASFAAAAAGAIFGSASTANLVNVLAGFVANWKAFYSSHGVPGILNASPSQIDLAARGAAWGDAVGIALANNLGPLNEQTKNFLEDAAQGTAVYSASLASQPSHAPFQGGDAVTVVGVTHLPDALT